ncbi:MAG: hypothetical protein R3C68_07230 [Myxococcota bacterium]
MMTMRRLLNISFVFCLASTAATGYAKKYTADAQKGNNSLTAVFDAPFGERITALSSAVSCELDVDSAQGTAKGHCQVPLTSVIVDTEATKTEHFYEWTTNKKMDPLKCVFELPIDAKAAGPLEAKKAVEFTFDGEFKVCGRTHADKNKEHIEGSVMLLPAGTYGKSEVLRIRAKISKFNREAYQIGPKWTGGWLARVQQLADVVAAEGEITLNIFAKAAE